jgi:hypothetical protein
VSRNAGERAVGELLADDDGVVLELDLGERMRCVGRCTVRVIPIATRTPT